MAIPAHAKKVFQGEIYSVWQWQQALYDGSTALFESVTRPDTVFTVGVLPDQRILLVKDTQPDRGTLLTPAGGRMEEGETPEQAAKREFREETGYAVDQLVVWFTTQPFGRTVYTVHLFIGKKLNKAGEPRLDPGEQIEVVTYSFDEFLALGSNPQLRGTELRLQLLEAQLDPAKRAALRKLLFE